MVPVHEWFCAMRFICYSKSWMPFPYPSTHTCRHGYTMFFPGFLWQQGPLWVALQSIGWSRTVSCWVLCQLAFTVYNGPWEDAFECKKSFSPSRIFCGFLNQIRKCPEIPHPKFISYPDTRMICMCMNAWCCSNVVTERSTGLYLWLVVTANKKYPVLNPEDATLVWHGNEAGVIGSWNECYTLDWEWGWYSLWEWGLLWVIRFVDWHLWYSACWSQCELCELCGSCVHTPRTSHHHVLVY